jgi:hypothetical protein
MNDDLLGRVIESHGGMNRWKSYEKVEAVFTIGGGLYKLKGRPIDPSPRRVTAWLREERTSFSSYGAPDQRLVFTPERISLDRLDGKVVTERRTPRESFAGHQFNTPWDELQRAYFSGYAMWTYLTTPFLLAMDGVVVEEIEPWSEGAETWRVLRAYFPNSIETHNQIQDFFFGEDLMLKRQDYSLNVAGGQATAQLITNYVQGNGVRMPSIRRAYGRGPDRLPIPEMLLVSIDISAVSFT